MERTRPSLPIPIIGVPERLAAAYCEPVTTSLRGNERDEMFNRILSITLLFALWIGTLSATAEPMIYVANFEESETEVSFDIVLDLQGEGVLNYNLELAHSDGLVFEGLQNSPGFGAEERFGVLTQDSDMVVRGIYGASSGFFTGGAEAVAAGVTFSKVGASNWQLVIRPDSRAGRWITPSGGDASEFASTVSLPEPGGLVSLTAGVALLAATHRSRRARRSDP